MPGPSTPFAAEAKRIGHLLGWDALFIHAVGASALPSAAAADPVELLVVLSAAPPLGPNAVAAALGYRPDPSQSGRFLRRSSDATRFVLTLAVVDDPVIAKALSLRDYLRTRPETPRGYARAGQRTPDELVHRAQAVWNTVPVLIVNGPTGVGKTTVGYACSEILDRQGIAHAVVDMDALSAIFPRSPHDRFGSALGLANLRTLWRNARAAGARAVILPRVVETAAEGVALASAIPGARVTTVRLRARLQELHRRLALRERGDSLSWHRARAAELSKQFEGADPSGWVIDTDDRAPEAVAAEISAGWRDLARIRGDLPGS